MVYKEKLLVLLVCFLVVVILVISFLYRARIGPLIKEGIVSLVPKWRYDECIKNFDVEKLDITDKKIWFADEDGMGYLLLNSKAMDAFISNNAKKCLYFDGSRKGATSLFNPELCWARQQNIQMFYDFAAKFKQKMPEEAFSKECQSFFLNQMMYFKEDVPENLRDRASKGGCQSMYQSYQKGTIVFMDPLFYDSKWPGVATCNCLDAEGKQRTCKSEFCEVMGFFAAVSKNDQSLCPSLSEVKVLPYCNFYFDKQTLGKYNDILRERYCQKK